MSFNLPTTAKSNHGICFQNKQNNHQLMPREQPGAGKPRQGPAKPTHRPSLMTRALGHGEPALLLLKARGAERDPREKGADLGNCWQKRTEDGYSTSGNKTFPRKLREAET